MKFEYLEVLSVERVDEVEHLDYCYKVLVKALDYYDISFVCSCDFEDLIDELTKLDNLFKMEVDSYEA